MEIMQKGQFLYAKDLEMFDEILSNCTTVEMVVAKNVKGHLKICYRDFT